MKSAVLRILAVLALASTAGQGATVAYHVILNGVSEAPPNASPGTGTGSVTFDTTLNLMKVNVTFSGLTGTTTATHIHAATATPFTSTAGVATQTPSFVGFPLGVTAGSYSNTFDMTLASSYNAAYVTANGGTPATAFSALMSAAAAGKAYLNIHTSTFGGGEIRGFLIPEPGTGAIIACCSVGIATIRRRKRPGF